MSTQLESLVTLKKYNYSSDKQKIINYFATHCKNEYFDKNYGCNSISTEPTEREPTSIYILYDKTDKSLVGFIIITEYDKYWMLNLISSRAKTNAKYRGSGTMLIDAVKRDMNRAKINYMFITGYSSDGEYLYLKMGFKHYGATGIMCLSLDGSIAHPNMLRQIDINTITYANKYRKQHKLPIDKLYYTKKQDTPEFRNNLYTTIQKNNRPEHTMLATAKMIQEIDDFPNELYKYGRTI